MNGEPMEQQDIDLGQIANMSVENALALVIADLRRELELERLENTSLRIALANHVERTRTASTTTGE